MKGLAKFLRFDTAAFLRDKELQITARSELVEYGTGQHQGTKFTVAITADKTMYPSGKDGTGEYSNLFEKFTVKVFKDINVPVGATVELVNPVGTVYGEFRNQLSVRARAQRTALLLRRHRRRLQAGRVVQGRRVA